MLLYLKKYFTNRSFTLIELLITLSITLILFGGGTALYNNSVEESKLKSESQKLVNVLELARRKSIASDLSLPCTGNFLGYRVALSPNLYEILSDCTTTDRSIQRYNLPLNILVDIPLSIDFKFLNGQATASCTRIRNTVLGKCRCIEVRRNGLISEAACTSCGSCP